MRTVKVKLEKKFNILQGVIAILILVNVILAIVMWENNKQWDDIMREPAVINGDVTIIERVGVQMGRAVREVIEGIKEEQVPVVELQVSEGYNVEKARTFMQNYRNGDSPMIEYVGEFFKGDPQKGKIALAIAGNETAFGTTNNLYNAWGYGCNYGGVRFDCGWRDWNYAITRYMQVADNYLSIYDGSQDSIRAIANAGYYKPGHDNSTQADQDRWISSVYWFTEQI